MKYNSMSDNERKYLGAKTIELALTPKYLFMNSGQVYLSHQTLPVNLSPPAKRATAAA